MKVILSSNIKGLGKEGDIVNVKEGYARNYLLPQGLALIANDTNLKRFKKLQAKKKEYEQKLEEKMKALQSQLENISLTIPVAAQEDSTLYGSVTNQMIAEALKNEGIDLAAEKIVLEEPIKKLGVYSLPINLYKGIQATLKVWIVKK